MREKNKLLSLVVLFCFSLSALSQADTGMASQKLNPQTDGTSEPMLQYPSLGLIYDWESNSTAFNNASLLSLITSNTISNDVKNSNGKNLRGKNYYVDHAEGMGYYVLPLKKYHDLGILFELGYVTHIDASFTKDAYELVMYGNAHYKNQTKNFGDMFVRNLSYQRLGIGIDKYFSKHTQHFRGSVNLIKGDYFNEFKINRGSLFTEENGEYLDIDLQYDRHFAAVGRSAYAARGYGAGFYGEWQKLFVKQGSLISIQVKDLGFIHYPDSTPHQSIDTAIHFTGLNFGSFQSYSNSADVNVSDSLQHYFNLKKGSQKYNLMLPLNIRLMYQKFGKKNDILKVQFNWYRYNASPQIILGYMYPLKTNLLMGADLRFGGYGMFDLDYRITYHKKKLFFDASLKSLEGLVFIKKASGFGVFLHLGYFL
jgi:hypothetical protein